MPQVMSRLVAVAREALQRRVLERLPLEHLTINQVCNTDEAASATRVLQIANADSTKIYLVR